jgi:MFS family permease
MIISIFFIAYLLFELPGNLILARVRPSWYLPTIMVLWGLVCACMSKVQNYGGMLACRFALGAMEAGFLPGVMFIMSSWYKKSEIGRSQARWTSSPRPT